MLSKFNLIVAHTLCLVLMLRLREFYPENTKAYRIAVGCLVVCIVLDILGVVALCIGV